MSAAIDGGASHVGLVFYDKSPRAVTMEQASKLSDQAQGNAVRVGLFVDPTDATLETILKTVLPDCNCMGPRRQDAQQIKTVLDCLL